MTEHQVWTGQDRTAVAGQEAARTLNVCFMVPCFNEEGNVVESIEDIVQAVVGRPLRYEILVIDDASTDRTGALVEAYQRQHPDLPIRLHRNDCNRGLGYNYFLGATLATTDYYMLVSGDRAQPTEAIAAVLEQLGRADIVIPYMEDQSERSLMRRFLSELFTILVNLCSGNRLRYYNGPVLHRRATVLRLRGNVTGFGYQAELLCRALNERCSFIEVSIPLRARTKGRTSAFRMANILSVFGSLIRICSWRLMGARAQGYRVNPVQSAASILPASTEPLEHVG